MRLCKVVIIGAAVAILAATAGCRTSTVYKEKVGATSSTIQTAEESGAYATETSASYLKQAKLEFDQAKELADRGRKEEAASLLRRAEADAELAAALAKEDAERKGAADAISNMSRLREENAMPKTETEGGTP